MRNSSQIEFIFISLLLIVNFDLSIQRSSSSALMVSRASPVAPASSIPSQSTALEPGSIITTIESLPAVELVRELIAHQNQLVDTLVPIMIRALTNPVPGLAEAIQRSLSLIGVTSYLVGPTIARSARSLSPVVEPLVGSTHSFVDKINRVTELEPLFEHTMTILGLESDQCREALACRVGKQVATDYPRLANYLSQASSTLKSEDDKIAKILIEVLSSSNSQCMSSCPNLSVIQKYWKDAGEKDLRSVVQDALLQ